MCVNGAGVEVEIVVPTPTGSDILPTSYNNCHAHGSENFCEDAEGNEVEIRSVSEEHAHEEEEHDDHVHGVADPEDHGHDEEGHDGHDHTETASPVATGQTTAITSCHIHEATPMCVNGDGAEVEVVVPVPTGEAKLPTEYTGCHAHGSEMFCKDAAGAEIEVRSALAAGDSHEGHGHEEAASGGEQTCHFHAGIEHCTGGSGEKTCGRSDREYNIKLRIGLLFVMLVGSALAVYLPLFLSRVLHMDTSGLVFTLIKQFGTGVIIATAFVHLLTHANLMFSNECLPPLKYEATTTAIAMAGAFIAFLIEYLGHRLAGWRRSVISSQPTPVDTPSNSSSDLGHVHESSKETAHAHGHDTHDHAHGPAQGLSGLSHHHHPTPDDDSCSIAPQDKFSVLVLEAGIIFHSILLGITLVVAGDSVFITLYVVILFHQMFEGLALGARIAALSPDPSHAHHKHWLSWEKVKDLVLPAVFACITPIGMAIGIGVLKSFNGNDPNTIIALGTLDALSAGILMWVGLVGMWAHDWMFGELRDAGWRKVVPAGIALVVGMILMGVLGKWA